MMQALLYALYVFTVQSNCGVATTRLLVNFEDLPYPPKVLYAPFLHQSDRKGCPGSY